MISLFQGKLHTMSHEGVGIHSPSSNNQDCNNGNFANYLSVVAGADLDFVLALVLLLESLEVLSIVLAKHRFR